MCRLLFLLLLTIACVSCQLGGFGGGYGNPYGMGYGYPGMGMGMGMGLGMDMYNNPYGYGSYYHNRCRNHFGLGGAYNPMYGNFMGKRKK